MNPTTLPRKPRLSGPLQLLAVVFLLTLPGCGMFGGTDADRAQLDKVLADYRLEVDAMTARSEAELAKAKQDAIDARAALAAATTQQEQAEAAKRLERAERAAQAIGGVDAILAKSQAVLDALQKQRDALASDNPGDAIKATGDAVGGAIGGPTGTLIGLGGTILGGLIGAGWKNRAMVALKGSALEALGTMSTAIAAGKVTMDEATRKELALSQSPEAKSLVREAQAEYSDAMTLARPKPTP